MREAGKYIAAGLFAGRGSAGWPAADTVRKEYNSSENHMSGHNYIHRYHNDIESDFIVPFQGQ